MYRYYFFDLDGTLTDPGAGITNSVMYSLRKMGREVYAREELYRFIGPPLLESYMDFCGFSREQAEKAIVYYREYFSEKGIFENEVYEGIPDLLAALKSGGKKLVLATSKPEPFAVRILKHFGLYPYFDVIGAATMDGSRSRKEDVIAWALEAVGEGAGDRAEILMVGDREQDIYGAKVNGIDSAGVLYGYGGEEELRVAGADYLVKRPADILKLESSLCQAVKG